jgi:hypothetical protein
MQYLTRISEKPEVSFYEIGGEHQTQVKRYIASTPQTRSICNRPEILGCDYTSLLRDAMVSVLKDLPCRSRIEAHPESRICVLNFLRGGLNFDLRNALHEAYNLNHHSSAFMSSQRYKVDGRWHIDEDMYRKLKIPKGSILLMADVVATGVTVENGLRVLLDHLVRIESSIQKIIFFTIGCHKVEKNFNIYDPLFRSAFPDYEGSSIVYLEGKFRLVDSRAGLRIAIQGTDLLRHNALLTPEFELSQYDSPTYPLERCTIYDAGSRAFDIPSYTHELLEYWKQVEALAEQGWTLQDALHERWPEHEYQNYSDFMSHKRQTWRDVENELLDNIYQNYRERWNDDFTLYSQSNSALLEICRERVATFEEMIR